MSFGMFEAAVAGDKENEHQKKLAKTRLAQAAAEVDQKLGSFLSKATSKSDYIERVRLAENDFREIVGKYLEGDTGFKAVATKMVDHYVKKVAFTDIKDIRDHVDGLGVKTRKKGDGFTFPAASGATGYITVRPNGEIVVETIIGGAGGFQSVYAPNEMDLVERWIEKTVGGSYRMSSRRHASSVYELAGELASQTGRSEQEMEEALILYLEQMESLDGVSYDEDNLPSEARDFLTEAVLHGISAGDFRSAKVRRPSRKARRKRADDHLDAPGVDMSQTMLDGMSGYGDAVAVAFDSNGNAVDLALNWETAQSMANEGYNMQAIRGDGGMSQDDIQRMVDYEKELVRDLYGSRRRRSNRRTARGVDFSRATYDLFEDGSGDSWYDLVDEDHRSYDSDDLDEVVHWLKQDGLLPYDGRMDTYTSDAYEDPYTSQRYEDSAALRGFTDEELHEIKRRMSSRRASRGRRPFDRVAGERPSMDEEVDWLNNANSGTTIQAWDPRGGEETEDGDYTGEYIKFVKTKSDKWYNNDYRTDLTAEELAGNEKPLKRSRRQRQAAGTNERFPGTNEMFERAGWQSTDPERSEWLSPSGYAMYDGSEGSVYYFDPDDVVSSFYTLEDEEFRDDLPQILTDDEEYQSRLWEY